MRRYQVKIQRGKNIETKILRAVQMSSVVAQAEDMIKADFSISNIIVTNLVTDETVVVR